MKDLSRFFARLFAVIYLAAGIGAFLDSNYYRSVLQGLFGNAAVTYMAGFLAVILGFLIIHFHNLWIRDWPVLITIVGWLALLKGVVLIAFPATFLRLTQSLAEGPVFNAFPYLAIFLGLLFGYFGFRRKGSLSGHG